MSADAGYGFSKSWRFELEQADVFHVVATTRHDTVVTWQAMDHRLHDLMTGLPRQKWKRRSCGDGAHGLRVYDWARVEVRPWHRLDRKHWVLARRSITDPTKIAYYIAYATLIAVAGAGCTTASARAPPGGGAAPTGPRDHHLLREQPAVVCEARARVRPPVAAPSVEDRGQVAPGRGPYQDQRCEWPCGRPSTSTATSSTSWSSPSATPKPPAGSSPS